MMTKYRGKIQNKQNFFGFFSSLFHSEMQLISRRGHPSNSALATTKGRGTRPIVWMLFNSCCLFAHYIYFIYVCWCLCMCVCVCECLCLCLCVCDSLKSIIIIRFNQCYLFPNSFPHRRFPPRTVRILVAYLALWLSPNNYCPNHRMPALLAPCHRLLGRKVISEWPG